MLLVRIFILFPTNSISLYSLDSQRTHNFNAYASHPLTLSSSICRKCQGGGGYTVNILGNVSTHIFVKYISPVDHITVAMVFLHLNIYILSPMPAFRQIRSRSKEWNTSSAFFRGEGIVSYALYCTHIWDYQCTLLLVPIHNRIYQAILDKSLPKEKQELWWVILLRPESAQPRTPFFSLSASIVKVNLQG